VTRVTEFNDAVLRAAADEHEIELTTYGRRTGTAHRTTLWCSGDGRRLFVRSGRGLHSDWARNILARPEGVLHVGGHEVAVTMRHVDTTEARAVTELVIGKYGSAIRRPEEGAPPTPGETATFELSPADGA
jgi:deazaflavin-dependent oxidoreductase (nitroreductase family)